VVPPELVCALCKKRIAPTQVMVRLRDGRETHVACAIMEGEWRSKPSAAAPRKDSAA
jgi:hypothetical protein